MPIKAVTFDLWNTLLCDGDFSSLRIAILRSILTEQDIHRDDSLIRTEYISAARRVDRAWSNEERSISLSELTEPILKNLDVNLSSELKRKLLRGFEEAIFDDVPPLVAGAERLLGELYRHYKIGLISDTGMTPGKVIRKVLDNYGLLRYFNCTVFSDEVGFPKPHPQMFHRAITGLDEEAKAIVHVGDLLRTDVAGAKSMGMRTIWFDRGNKPKETLDVLPDHVVGDLCEVLGFLEIEGSADSPIL